MRLNRILSCLGISFWATLIYWPSFRAPFQLDDFFVVVTNPVITRLCDLSGIWSFDPSRFLTYLSFAANYHFVGVDPAGYHVVNFCLHLLATGLVFWLIMILVEGEGEALFKMSNDKCRMTNKFQMSNDKCQMTNQFPMSNDQSQRINHVTCDEGVGDGKRVAIMSALIFLVHPIQTSAVTYVAQRSTLLASVAFLAGVIFYIRYRQTERFADYLFALSAAAAGVFCKPIIVTLPFVLLLYEISFGRVDQRWPARMGNIVPFLLVVLVVPMLLLILRYQNVSGNLLTDVTRETATITRGHYLLTQTHVFWTYLQLLLAPVGQNIDYDYPIVKSLFSPFVLVATAGIFSFLTLAVRVWQRNRLLGFGIFWFIITLSLESSIFPISDVIFEHRLYLPMFGFALVVGWLLVRFVSINFYKFLLISILLLLSFLTFQRNQVWSDRIGFLEDVAAKSPNKSRVHNSLALAYIEEGRYGKALAELQQAIQLDPKDIRAYSNRANIYRITGQYYLAIKEYDFIIAHAPEFSVAYYFRSRCWLAKGEKDKALCDALMARSLGFTVGEDYIRLLSGKGN